MNNFDLDKKKRYVEKWSQRMKIYEQLLTNNYKQLYLKELMVYIKHITINEQTLQTIYTNL